MSKVSPDIVRDPVPWAVKTNSKGIWPWVYFNRKPVWVENIIESRNNEKGTINLLDNSEISLDSLEEIFPSTDSIMAIPLKFNQNIEGIYCIEFSRSKILTKRVFELMERLSSPFASFIWKMKVNKMHKSQSSTAIDRFKATISEMILREFLSQTQKGIFIRPFGDKYNKIEDCVKNTLGEQGIEVEHYIAGHERYIPGDIAAKIKLTPFGVADITEFNPNVMIELGMLQALSKNTLLLIKKGTSQELPFHLKNEPINYYEEIGSDIHISDPATGSLIRLEEKLNTFVADLRATGKVH